MFDFVIVELPNCHPVLSVLAWDDMEMTWASIGAG
jgi:hypothetical protein